MSGGLSSPSLKAGVGASEKPLSACAASLARRSSHRVEAKSAVQKAESGDQVEVGSGWAVTPMSETWFADRDGCMLGPGSVVRLLCVSGRSSSGGDPWSPRNNWSPDCVSESSTLVKEDCVSG